MARIFLINVCRTFIVEGGKEEIEVGREATLKAENKEDGDEYVEDEGDGEDAAFESTRVRVEM